MRPGASPAPPQRSLFSSRSRSPNHSTIPSARTSPAQPSVIGPRIYLHTTNGGFNLGVAKNSDTDWYWDTTTYNTNQTIFLVGSYTFTTVGNTTDDIAKLWINPDPTTFGAPGPPSPTV